MWWLPPANCRRARLGRLCRGCRRLLCPRARGWRTCAPGGMLTTHRPSQAGRATCLPSSCRRQCWAPYPTPWYCTEWRSRTSSGAPCQRTLLAHPVGSRPRGQGGVGPHAVLAGQGGPLGPPGQILLCLGPVARALPTPGETHMAATTQPLVREVLECHDALPSTGPVSRAQGFIAGNHQWCILGPFAPYWAKLG